VDIEDPSQLIAYLRAQGRIGTAETPTCRLLEGGVSNRTVLVERFPDHAGPVGLTDGDRRWVLKQALARLRVAVEWHARPERIQREAAGMVALAEILPAGSVPTLVFEDREHHLLAMTAVAMPHDNWRDLLLADRLVTDHLVQFGSMLAIIHRRSMERERELAPRFIDDSFFESLRIEPYYQFSASACPRAAGFLGDLIIETRLHRLALVHGDYSPKNILVAKGRLVLLDHEVIHWGDPAFDVGFALSHLLAKANHLSARRRDYAEGAALVWNRYRGDVGQLDTPPFEARCVRHLAACLLARVVGRSPLGYLNPAAQHRQREVVLALLERLPTSVPAFITAFTSALGASAQDQHADHR
jgi:5-methylthioribose kinase